MSQKKACKNCRRIYEEQACPNCSSNDSTKEYKGVVVIFDPQNSEIAKNMKIDKAGEYAIKAR
ncbi:DNA-directed RNA polymerase, subunit E'' [Candidatus Pacearchaeota archaeon]|nr:DNA-directed RNA polymerase, subunit E'' [Candidatus Pacearchaeota archaeon]